MKVSITKNSKKVITLAEASIAQRIIEDLKQNDEWTAKDYAVMAVRVADPKAWDIEVLKASAEIAKNARAWDSLCEDSGTLDVWIEATAQTSNGFVIIGAYLSDIWSISTDNEDYIRSHMYIRRFKEV